MDSERDVSYEIKGVRWEVIKGSANQGGDSWRDMLDQVTKFKWNLEQGQEDMMQTIEWTCLSKFQVEWKLKQDKDVEGGIPKMVSLISWFISKILEGQRLMILGLENIQVCWGQYLFELESPFGEMQVDQNG